MKTTIKFGLYVCLSFLIIPSLSFAEGEKVIIDTVNKKIIIQSGDQNLDIDSLKSENINTTTETNEQDDEQNNENTTTDEVMQENPSLYDELNSGDEFENALYRMFQNGLTKYDNATDYRPDDYLLREEAAKIIGQAYNILGYSKEVKNDQCNFIDKDTFDPTLSEYINSTCSYGIFKGSNGNFLAHKSLTKAEGLTVLIRILEETSSSEEFNPRRTMYFVKAKSISLTKETDVNSLDRPLTRREIALLIHRFKTIVLNSKLNSTAKNQFNNINANPEQYIEKTITQEANNQEGESQGEENNTTNSENNEFLGVLSGVEFNSTSSLSILNSPEIVEAIQWMKDHGLTNAKDVTTYNPFDYLTREQAAKMFAQFAKALNYTAISGEVASCNFSDLDDADASLKASIQEVCALGIMQGSNGAFSPTTQMTKSQFVTMLIRLSEGKRLDESGNPWRANYFIKAGELGILSADDISSFEGLLTRYEAALLFYRFQLKQTISSGMNTESLKNELLSSLRSQDGDFASGDIENSYAVNLDNNLLKNQFFQEGYLELLGTRYILKKTGMTVFDLGDESFVWYGDLIDLISDTKIGTVNFIVSNGNTIQGTIRLTTLNETWTLKESRNTTARYNIIKE